MGQCQSPADWWYFGDSAGIHFTPSGPVADTNGVLNTGEGCASISDLQGNLLFYTDGTTVYDQNHQEMPNGNGLSGNFSSTQSAVIVPFPGQSNKYVLFTNSGQTSPAFFAYSIVDMTLNGGFGDVVVAEKNVFLMNGTTEKLAATRSDNGFWVLTSKYTVDSLYAFEVTSAGVSLTPVESHTGVVFGYAGCMKLSPNGNILAGNMNSGFSQGLLLMNFNQSNGVASSPIILDSNLFSAYGLEFSPNSEYLYTTNFSTLFQFNVTNLSLNAIISSFQDISPGLTCASAQIGPDGKIYIATLESYLHVIDQPNQPGSLSNVLINEIPLLGRTSQLGLPPFVSSFFLSFSYVEYCFGDSMNFTFDVFGLDSVIWNFGDPASGIENTSTLFSPAHLFTDTGDYTVTLIAYTDSIIDTLVQTVFVYPRQNLDLGPDTLLCDGDTLELNIQQEFSTYLWDDGSSEDSILITSSDQISVTLFGVCDTLQDTINVRFDKPVQINLGPDTTFCEGSTIELDADVAVNADYQWNTGDTADRIIVNKSGLYIFQAENGCGEFNDSISVTIIPLPDTALLPSDTINCFDNQIILERPVNDSITYIWSDSTTGPRFEVDSTQQVWLASFNECGFVVDTINILFNGEIKTELGEDTNICDKDSIQLSGVDSTALYQWSTGDTSISIWTEVGEDENYIVTIFKGECAKVESRRVRSSDVFCPSIDCDLEYGNVFSPNGDGMNDLFRITSDCDVYTFDMTIYNRWGQLVNYSQNVAFGWDGFINGEPAAEGVYYFVVEYKDFVVVDADRQLTRGSFTLIR